MSRKWCIVVRPSDTASSGQVRAIADTFAVAAESLEWQREGTDWRVYVDELDDPDGGEAAVVQMLSQADLLSAVDTPFPVGLWFESLGNYVIGESAESGPVQDPAVPGNEVTWIVSVRASSAFDWNAMRAELAQRGRTTVRETDSAVDVAARDETDANELVAELLMLPTVGSANAKPLSKLGRWKVREQMLGNYIGPLDGLFDGPLW
jgi:hypothetical protein